MAATRRAEARWSGPLSTGSGTVSAVTSARFTDLAVSWAARTEAPGGKTSPEELLAAAHAACFAMALSGALGRAGTPPEQLDVAAEVTFDKLEAGWRVVSSALTVQAAVPGIAADGLRCGGRGDEDRLPDRPGPGRQCRDHGQGDAPGLRRRATVAGASRSSGVVAGSTPSSSRSRHPIRRLRAAGAGTSSRDRRTRAPRSGSAGNRGRRPG